MVLICQDEAEFFELALSLSASWMRGANQNASDAPNVMALLGEIEVGASALEVRSERLLKRALGLGLTPTGYRKIADKFLFAAFLGLSAADERAAVVGRTTAATFFKSLLKPEVRI